VKEEISLKSIFEIIKNKIIIILTATVLVTIAAAIITKFYISPKYTSSIKLCVVSDIDTDGDSSSAANQRNTILYAKDLIETCIEALDAGDAYAEMNGRLREIDATYENTDVDSSNISIMQVGGSNVLRITATTSKAQLSYDVCQAFEAMAKNRVPTVGEVKVEKLDSPVLAQSPSSPSMVKNCILGALIGFLMSAIVIIIIAMLDNTVKDGAETARQLNILLLGEIPDIYSAKERERYYEYKISSSQTGGKKRGR